MTSFYILPFSRSSVAIEWLDGRANACQLSASRSRRLGISNEIERFVADKI